MVSDFDKGRDTKKFFRIQIYDTFYLNIGDRGYYCFLAITAQDWTRKDRTGINQMELLTDRAEAANFYDFMETYYVDASWSPNSRHGVHTSDAPELDADIRRVNGNPLIYTDYDRSLKAEDMVEYCKTTDDDSLSAFKTAF